jgi:hypothetical protein
MPDWEKYRLPCFTLKELAHRAANELIPVMARDLELLTDEEWDILEHYEPRHRIIRALAYYLGVREIKHAADTFSEDMGDKHANP